jgi:prophage regulatory protein
MQTLPTAGYLREPDLIGRPPVTTAEAAANQCSGRGPKRARPGKTAIIPWSSATLWRAVKAKRFPSPVKLGENCTAWKIEDVRRWMAERDALSAKVQAPPESSEAGSATNTTGPEFITQQTGPDCEGTDERRKRFSTIAAALALKGYSLHQTTAGTFIVTKWNLARDLSNIGAVQAFAAAVGASL